MIIGSDFIFLTETSSTNVFASELLKKRDIREGTIIYASYQNAGKGQSANKWESARGKNLLLTVILYPTATEPHEQFLISMTISLGIRDFFKRYVDSCTVKWPNDIYVKNDKIAGILIENSIIGSKIESSIAGAGLNINQEHFESDAPNPVSLKMLTGKSYDLELCMKQLSSDLDKRYKQLLADERDQIRSDYLSALYRLNEWSRFKTGTGMLEGRIISVTGSGLLEVEERKGTVNRYAFKEIEFTDRLPSNP